MFKSKIPLLLLFLLFSLNVYSAPKLFIWLQDGSCGDNDACYGSSSTYTTIIDSKFGSSNVTKSTSAGLPDASTLATYDAILIEMRSISTNTEAISASDIAKLNTFLTSGKRVYALGENGHSLTETATAWNNSILDINLASSAGASYTKGTNITYLGNHNYVATIPGLTGSAADLTSGVTNVATQFAGNMTYGSGTPLFECDIAGCGRGTDLGVSVLFGPNENLLVTLDVNWLTDTTIAYKDNTTFFTNIVAWLYASSPTDADSPTVTFTPSNGATGVSADSNITITFNEAVRKLDDSTITDSNVDSLVELKLADSSGAAISFDATISSDKTTITINPTDNLTAGATIYVNLTGSLEDAANNAVSATSITFSVGSDNPFEKADVVGNIEAMSNAAIRFSRMNINSVNNRFRWLRANKNNKDTSYQGIQVTANGRTVGSGGGGIEQFKSLLPQLQNSHDSINSIPTSFSNSSSSSNFRQSPITANNSIEFNTGNANPSNEIFSGQSIKLAIADKVEDVLLGSLDINQSGSKYMDEYSIWTDGQIDIGDIKFSGVSSKQNFHGFNIAIGIDKMNEKNEIIGVALNFAEIDTKVGAVGSKVDSKNVGLSIYGNKKLENGLDIEAQAGFSSMDFDTNRIDSDQTLKGSRNGQMLFASLAVVPDKAIQFNKMHLTPYGRGEWSYIELDKYSESGGSYALNFHKQHINRYMIFTGTDAYFDLDLANGKLKPFVGFEYGLDLTKDSDVGLSYVNNSTNEYHSSLKMVAKSNIMMRVGADYHAENGVNSSVAFEQNEAIGYGSYYTFRFQLSIPLALIIDTK
jgi:uncharacterized protein with beta-barrel porin domain